MPEINNIFLNHTSQVLTDSSFLLFLSLLLFLLLLLLLILLLLILLIIPIIIIISIIIIIIIIIIIVIIIIVTPTACFDFFPSGSSVVQNLCFHCVGRWNKGLLSLAPEVLSASKVYSPEYGGNELCLFYTALFSDQDDELIDALLLLLLLFQKIGR